MELREHEINREKMVSILGRRLDPKSAIKGTNTQALTFDSRKVLDGLFIVEPKFLRNINCQHALRSMLQSRTETPYCQNHRIYINSISIERFVSDLLSVLAAIEKYKSKNLNQNIISEDLKVLVTNEELKLVFNEGFVREYPVKRRVRSVKLRELAIQRFKAESPDGLLRCCICNWFSPVETQCDVVQIHHESPIFKLPQKGKKFVFEEAIKQLFPLCPNCHQILHSKPGSGRYTVQELKSMILPTTCESND